MRYKLIQRKRCTEKFLDVYVGSYILQDFDINKETDYFKNLSDLIHLDFIDGFSADEYYLEFDTINEFETFQDLIDAYPEEFI